MTPKENISLIKTSFLIPLILIAVETITFEELIELLC